MPTTLTLEKTIRNVQTYSAFIQIEQPASEKVELVRLMMGKILGVILMLYFAYFTLAPHIFHSEYAWYSSEMVATKPRRRLSGTKRNNMALSDHMFHENSWEMSTRPGYLLLAPLWELHGGCSISGAEHFSQARS